MRPAKQSPLFATCLRPEAEKVLGNRFQRGGDKRPTPTGGPSVQRLREPNSRDQMRQRTDIAHQFALPPESLGSVVCVVERAGLELATRRFIGQQSWLFAPG